MRVRKINLGSIVALGVCLTLPINDTVVGTSIHASPPVHRSTSENPRSLLFIGNSFTYYNGGLKTHVVKLAQSAAQPKVIKADSVTKGGATLEVLYQNKLVRDKLRQGGFDVVIVQGDIPEIKQRNVEPFLEFARAFHLEIQKQGGATVFLMAWPYERLDWVNLPEIAKAHRDIGGQLRVPVAPVGLAFRRAMRERPKLNMLGKDKEHENMHGTYLAAGVIYATVFGQSPQECTYRPNEVSADEAAFLQRIAWETVTEWQKQNKLKESD